MKRKSKFLTVILSVIPGLGHSYLGYSSRGMIFFVPAVIDIIITIFMMATNILYDPIPLILLPFIWLGSLVDSLILVDKINKSVVQNDVDFRNETMNFNTVIPILFSFFPGAGHMSLKMMRKGIQLMGTFLGTIALIDYFNISFLYYMIPIFFFYSLFDVLTIVTNKEDSYNKESGIPIIDRLFDTEYRATTGKGIGLGLIILGLVIIGDNIFFPVITKFIKQFADSVNIYELRYGMRVLLLGVVMIIGGIRLIFKERKELDDEQL